MKFDFDNPDFDGDPIQSYEGKPLRLPNDPAVLAQAEEMNKMVGQCLLQGVRHAEIAKTMARCNPTQGFFDLDRFLKMLTDLSLSQWEKQKACSCAEAKIGDVITVNKHHRCIRCSLYHGEDINKMMMNKKETNS